VAFPSGHQLIRRNAFELLDEAIGPMDFNIRVGACSQTKVEPAVVDRIEAGLTYDGLGLHLATILKQNPRTERASI
jgi:hypothetical protein